jgi:hypothetical protein
MNARKCMLVEGIQKDTIAGAKVEDGHPGQESCKQDDIYMPGERLRQHLGAMVEGKGMRHQVWEFNDSISMHLSFWHHIELKMQNPRGKSTCWTHTRSQAREYWVQRGGARRVSQKRCQKHHTVPRKPAVERSDNGTLPYR